MVARPGTYQASNNAGELKPELHGRTDIKQFFAGLALALNVEPVPQAGSRLSPRSRHLSRIRRVLEAVPIGFNSMDGGPYAAPAVVATVALPSRQPLSIVTLANWSATPPVPQILWVEFFDGASWQPFSHPFAMGALGNYTAALPPGQQVLTDSIRLRLVEAPPSPATFTAGAGVMQLRRETAQLPKAKVKAFTFSLTQTYTVVLTPGFADFYRDGVYVGSCITGIAAEQLDELDVRQRLDTMLLFYRELEPIRILRNGADHQWVAAPQVFDNVPAVDLGGSYVNQVTDIWKVYFNYPTSGGFANGTDLFVSFAVNGEQTYGVPTAGSPGGVPGPPGTDPPGGAANWPAFAAAVTVAIEALPSVRPGIVVTEDHSTAGITILTVNFTGAGNNGSRNALSAQVVNTGLAAATVYHFQLGVAGGEPLISSAAGWPACAAFYQDRLITGGFKSKQGAFLASVTGEYFDLNTASIAPSGAMLENIDTDGAERLHAIVSSRFLALFTTDAEYFISNRTLDRTVPPNIVNASRNGSAPGVPIVDSENALLYVTRDRNLLMEAKYDSLSDSFNSDPISLLASHIASGMLGMARQKAATATDAARLWIPRDDGSMVVGIMLRGQDVTAFVRWQTPGLVRDACVDGRNVPHILVERTVGGAAEMHLERCELGLIFDGTIEQSFDPPRQSIPGLEAHEGAEVWAQADGYVAGPFTVAAGTIELAEPAGHVLVGRWTAPRAMPLPLQSEVADGIVVKRPKRVHTVRINLVDTTSLAIGANGLPPRDVALGRAGDPLDAPQAPVTREQIITGLRGFSTQGQFEITQVRPGLLAWSSFTRETRK